MTIVDSQTDQRVVDQAQLLFQEAKQLRRRRWLISGIVAVILVGVVGIAIGLSGGRTGGGRSKPAGTSVSPPAAATSTPDFSFRPVLCYAPPFTAAATHPVSTGPLPPCAAPFELTAANLGVAPNANTVNGYTSNSNIRVDPQFAAYPSTSSLHDAQNATVLLPGTPTQGDTRYVLGPAGLTSAAITSARAVFINGHWVVNLDLTAAGAAQWDGLAQKQFHAIVGIVDNGQVISAPITQPSQTSFASFDGQVQISGAFTEHQATALAARI